MKIGDLSARTGVSQRMLRYYEDAGLIKPVRSAAGYRHYDEKWVKLVSCIKILSTAGMKLDAIKVLLPCLSNDDPDPAFYGCAEVRQVLNDEIERLNTKMNELESSRKLVSEFAKNLAG